MITIVFIAIKKCDECIIFCLFVCLCRIAVVCGFDADVFCRNAVDCGMLNENREEKKKGLKCFDSEDE